MLANESKSNEPVNVNRPCTFFKCFIKVQSSLMQDSKSIAQIRQTMIIDNI